MITYVDITLKDGASFTYTCDEVKIRHIDNLYEFSMYWDKSKIIKLRVLESALSHYFTQEIIEDD